jgi:hypothetical protein
MLEIPVDRGLLFLPAMIPRLCLEDRLSAIPLRCFQPKAKRFLATLLGRLIVIFAPNYLGQD